MLISADGELVAARMAGHTMNAGRIYFAAGSFEPADFDAEGLIDPHFNMAREVKEETGLDLPASSADKGFHAFSSEVGTVIFRRYQLDEDAETIAARIREFVAAEEEPEIEAPVIIRRGDVLGEELMPHMRPLIDWHFGRGA